ncbi:MAG: hypothetical protein HS113_24210 [Verrucomicrobiales bacterium]|nr:hypothetical protein [Verrucomicrobiales bacterium]
MRNVSFSRAAGGPLFVGLMAGYLTVTAAPAGDDFAWLRGANFVPSYARNDVQIWDRHKDIRRVQELGRRLGKPVVILEVVMRPQQPHPAPPPLPGEALPVPRLLFGDATRHGRPFAKDPSVLRLGDRYLMYYSMAPSTNPASPKGWAIGIAESRDLTDWQKVGEILPNNRASRMASSTAKPSARRQSASSTTVMATAGMTPFATPARTMVSNSPGIPTIPSCTPRGPGIRDARLTATPSSFATSCGSFTPRAIPRCRRKCSWLPPLT